MTDLGRVGELKAHRDAVARAWYQAMLGQDKMILAKINSYLQDGSYEAEMPTQLLQAQETLLEVLGDGGT